MRRWPSCVTLAHLGYCESFNRHDTGPWRTLCDQERGVTETTRRCAQPVCWLMSDLLVEHRTTQRMFGILRLGLWKRRPGRAPLLCGDAEEVSGDTGEMWAGYRHVNARVNPHHLQPRFIVTGHHVNAKSELRAGAVNARSPEGRRAAPRH